MFNSPQWPKTKCWHQRSNLSKISSFSPKTNSKINNLPLSPRKIALLESVNTRSRRIQRWLRHAMCGFIHLMLLLHNDKTHKVSPLLSKSLFVIIVVDAKITCRQLPFEWIHRHSVKLRGHAVMKSLRNNNTYKNRNDRTFSTYTKLHFVYNLRMWKV